MNEALGRLPTERVDDRYTAIDTASVIDLATLMNEADMTVPAAVRAALPQIVDAVDAVIDGLARGGLDVKTAIVTIGTSCDVADARRRLSAAGGRLRKARAGQ